MPRVFELFQQSDPGDHATAQRHGYRAGTRAPARRPAGRPHRSAFRGREQGLAVHRLAAAVRRIGDARARPRAAGDAPLLRPARRRPRARRTKRRAVMRLLSTSDVESAAAARGHPRADRRGRHRQCRRDARPAREEGASARAVHSGIEALSVTSATCSTSSCRTSRCPTWTDTRCCASCGRIRATPRCRRSRAPDSTARPRSSRRSARDSRPTSRSRWTCRG